MRRFVRQGMVLGAAMVAVALMLSGVAAADPRQDQMRTRDTEYVGDCTPSRVQQQDQLRSSEDCVPAGSAAQVRTQSGGAVGSTGGSQQTAQMQSQAQAQARSQAQAGTPSQVGAQAGTQAQVRSQSGTQAQSGVSAQVGTQSQVQTRTRVQDPTCDPLEEALQMQTRVRVQQQSQSGDDGENGARRGECRGPYCGARSLLEF